MNMTWDAKEYREKFRFVHEYGNDVINLLDIRKGMTVLDLGCGDGALSQKLNNLGTRVIGIDASPELLSVAKKQYPEIVFYEKDATNFQLDEKVDAVFSNAVLHWIDGNHQSDVLRCVHAVLKEGGQFVFEFGGHGNNRLIHEALRDAFERRGYEYKVPFYFPTIGEYIPLLETAGFQVRDAILFDRMTELKGHDGLTTWIEMFIKEPFKNLPMVEKQEIVKEAVDQLQTILCYENKWYADYVRLRCKAIKL